MSSGGLSQLVAFGSQDVHLTSSPQVTFFRVIHRRHGFFKLNPEMPPEGWYGVYLETGDVSGPVRALNSRNFDMIFRANHIIELRRLEVQIFKRMNGPPADSLRKDRKQRTRKNARP